jgi:hypothetical protein
MVLLMPVDAEAEYQIAPIVKAPAEHAYRWAIGNRPVAMMAPEVAARYLNERPGYMSGLLPEPAIDERRIRAIEARLQSLEGTDSATSTESASVSDVTPERDNNNEKPKTGE